MQNLENNEQLHLAVCKIMDRLDVELPEMRNTLGSTKRGVADARAIVCHFLRHNTSLYLKEIAKLINVTNHASVIRAIRRADCFLKYENDFINLYNYATRGISFVNKINIPDE